MTFTATIRDANGATRAQHVEAPSRAEALRILKADGVAVLALTAMEQNQAGASTADARPPALPRPITKLDIELGLQQLSSMLRGGLPLLSALRTAAEQARHARADALWNRLADAIESGLTLSGAMEQSGYFDAYTLALIRVGEQSGELDRAMAHAADHLEKSRSLRAMLVNALTYPFLVIILTIGVTGFMVIKVIPQMQQFLQTGNQALPYITQLLMDISDFCRLYMPYMLTGLVVLVAGILLLRLYPPGREWLDAANLRIPVIGRMLRLSGTTTAARGLSILLESGVTLLDGLDSTASLLRNHRLARRIRDARTAVMHGQTFSSALAKAPEFLPMFRRMTAVGESTGTLGATLGEVAAFHENMLLAAIRRFGILMEPILIFIVGGIVGFVYIAFFLALFSLASVY